MQDRKRAGPKVTLPNRRTVNVSLTDALIDKARVIGHGNTSKGVREAVEAYRVKGEGK